MEMNRKRNEDIAKKAKEEARQQEVYELHEQHLRAEKVWAQLHIMDVVKNNFPLDVCNCEHCQMYGCDIAGIVMFCYKCNVCLESCAGVESPVKSDGSSAEIYG